MSRMATIEVPVVHGLDGYQTNRVDLHLNHTQSTALKCIRDALDASGARIANGNKVRSPGEAIRWLLEQVHAADVKNRNGDTKNASGDARNKSGHARG